MIMPGRKYPINHVGMEKYRYGFNGKELDNETSTYDYGFRIYNFAISKFLSVDPLSKKFPMLTTYQFASNTPIWAVDLDGLEAHVIIHEHYHGLEKPIIRVEFDENLINPGGVYTVHNFYNAEDPTFMESQSWGSANYSDYPDMFPNNGNYWREDGKSLITLEGHGRIVWGEIGININEYLSAEFGFDGTLIGGEFEIGKNGFNGSIKHAENSNINFGGGASFIVGGSYRRHFTGDLRMLDSDNLSIGISGGLFAVEQNINTFDLKNEATQTKIGVPSFKVAIGLGIDIGAYFSINPQPNLTSFEKKEKKAFNKNIQPKNNDPTVK